ncbi:MAG: VaFE repeat-containing surface-anchored protein, partial [Ruminiclostridium sp.]|nr:VaFE repeat-containing surface-anchored protein [Ruminiclostridium sp.]
GKTYTVKGILMTPSFEWDKRETGVPFLVGGKQVTAEKTFTPTSANGTVTLSFTFDTSEITQNTKVVVFEEVYTDGREDPIASHKDINDRDQTVEIHKPKITTSATSYNRKDVIGIGTITIDDSVEYSDLIVGEQYTVKGVLMDKSTGKALTVNGKTVESQTTFTATATEGTVAVRFTFNASDIAKTTTVVAYERLYYGSIEIAAHTDINDSSQTVDILKPQLSTTATSMNEKHNFGIGNVTIDDAVAYSNLIEEQEYTLVGILMDKSTGKAFTVNGNTVESRPTFTAKSSSGTVAVRFAFDVSGITANTKLVVFETLYRNGTEIANHKDINDNGQTVEIHKPSIGTTATVNGEKEAVAVGTITVNDVVSYTDLIVGKEYTVSGTLMDRFTAAPFTVNGKAVTAQAKFTPTASNGTVTVKFTFDASGITKNTKLVAFETLYYNGVELADHKEINDAGQTVEIHKPNLSTTATVDGEKETVAVGTVTVNDVVNYSDLIVGKKYTVTGTLMDKSTAAPFVVNGKAVTATAEFTPKTSSGSVTVAFTFDASGITKNTKLVAYERMYLNGVEITTHTDINDTAQTVEIHKPKISTTATSNGEKEVIAVGTVTIDDVVSYSDLIVGKEYTLNGVLMNKATGNPFTVNGKEVTAQAKFTPTTANGTAAVKFTFDASTVTAKTLLVVYERLYLGSKEIAAHTNINDEKQTVEVHKPSIGTTATSNGEKETIGVGTVTINDTVAYHDLIVGKEYTVSGVLMNKATGKPFTVNGKEVTSSVKFTAKAA